MTPGHPNHDVPYVVVGIDGDPRMNRAPVVWAAHEAALRGTALYLVHGCEAAGSTLAPYAPQPDPARAGEQRRAVREIMDAAEQDAHRERPGLTVVRQSIEGRAVPVLLSATVGAVLLVLGTRTEPGRMRPVGAVGRECLRCAPCPVVTVSAADVSHAQQVNRSE
ncbi:universal stress protein [Embleya sp. NPDC055664]